jgi:hypothetical protein
VERCAFHSLLMDYDDNEAAMEKSAPPEDQVEQMKNMDHCPGD